MKNRNEILALAVAVIITIRITWDCVHHDMPIVATAAIALSLLVSSRLGALTLLRAWAATRKARATR
ncbi:hypothetical protein [Streptomyces sp. NPDC093269]|uniref:hypothetical protein n=1 Tax=Streptomyces sp. NPDC093269 TaxID=3366038 RepID=UPI003802D4DE